MNYANVNFFLCRDFLCTHQIGTGVVTGLKQVRHCSGDHTKPVGGLTLSVTLLNLPILVTHSPHLL